MPNSQILAEVTKSPHRAEALEKVERDRAALRMASKKREMPEVRDTAVPRMASRKREKPEVLDTAVLWVESVLKLEPLLGLPVTRL